MALTLSGSSAVPETPAFAKRSEAVTSAANFFQNRHNYPVPIPETISQQWDLFQPTPEQQAIFEQFIPDPLLPEDARDYRDRHLMIKALAGSGKTTVLRWLLYHWRKNQPATQRGYRKCLYLAYGRELANEAAIKFASMPGANYVMTSHQYGLAVIRNHEAKRGLHPEVSTTDKRARDAAQTCGWTDRFTKDQLAKIAGWLRNGMLGPMPAPGRHQLTGWFEEVIAVADVVHDPVITREWFKELLRKPTKSGAQIADMLRMFCSMIQNRQPGALIDFDDMLWLPEPDNPEDERGILGLGPDDLVLVDELQDWNPAQIGMLQRIVLTGARVVAVGDPNQAIYGFRAGPFDAMEAGKKVLSGAVSGAVGGCRVLPMTVSQRCSKLVGELATRIVPEFKTRENVKAGTVLVEESVKNPRALFQYDRGGVRQTSPSVRAGGPPFILARTNATLLPYALYFWRVGIPFAYEFNIAGRVKTVLDSFSPSLDFLQQVKLWKDVKSNQFYGQAHRSAMVEETAACLELFGQTVGAGETKDHKATLTSVRVLVDNITGTTRDKAAFILSTVHGAKGLEAHTVYLVGTKLMPHPMSTKPWERKQEANIAYVAVTRAKEWLVMDEWLDFEALKEEGA